MGYPDKRTQNEYQRRWLLARRQAWIDEHGPCQHCGSEENLEIDHIDPATKEAHVGTLWSRRKEVRDAELAKCQVLCEPCHITKTNEQMYGLPEHGKNSTYMRHGCRCQPCITAASVHRNTGRARRKAWLG